MNYRCKPVENAHNCGELQPSAIELTHSITRAFEQLNVDFELHWGCSGPGRRLLVEVWGELPDSVRNRILKLADDAVRVPG